MKAKVIRLSAIIAILAIIGAAVPVMAQARALPSVIGLRGLVN